ncbi:glycosyltransferase family 1 protein [Flagellimonas aquimarina]|uniref:Glycosyltransferase family 1 protein n=1 Tax=Flagellimonas aquimarina TaxID=2201895 RepID=A0A316LIC9_9FLAO|nr:glycosyltransferase [Allomuricauda koreensis]PWL39840.1 glycosyltransferase family 1 protein [Allomuricauda koreensis]
MKEKIKIIHILNSVGGVDVALRLILENLDSKIFKSIAIHGINDTTTPYLDDKGEEVEEYKISIQRDISLFKDFKALIKALRIIKREKPDLIHAHSAKGGILGKTIGAILNIPSFHTPQAYSYLSAQGWFKRSMYLRLERMTSFANSKVLASSQSEMNRALKEVKYKKEKVLLFNNSITASQDVSQLSINKTWPDNYICSVGRPSYQKNIEMMIRVLAEVKHKQSEVHLVLMGIGYHSPNLSKIDKLITYLGLTENVTLLPWTSREDIFNIISNARFYISTARYEGLPYSIIETLMLGKACVATDCDGNRDLIQDGYNGFLVPQEDIVEMSEKIVRLHLDSQLRKGFEVNAVELFERNFNMEKNIEQLEKIYETEVRS